MTRKEYKAIASAFADSLPPEPEKDRRRQWLLTAQCVADVLEYDNPRFDRIRFLAACTKDSEVSTH